MPLFLYRCPTTGHRVQGFASEDVVEDHHVYEPVTCLACRKIHHVYRGRLGEAAEPGLKWVCAAHNWRNTGKERSRVASVDGHQQPSANSWQECAAPAIQRLVRPSFAKFTKN
jgi:hypothetical protein